MEKISRICREEERSRKPSTNKSPIVANPKMQSMGGKNLCPNSFELQNTKFGPINSHLVLLKNLMNRNPKIWQGSPRVRAETWTFTKIAFLFPSKLKSTFLSKKNQVKVNKLYVLHLHFICEKFRSKRCQCNVKMKRYFKKVQLNWTVN